MTLDRLVSLIEAFMRKHSMSAHRFGLEAVGDSHFVFDLREGREPRARTVKRANEFMLEYDVTARKRTAA